jgi:deoxyribonucleoside regulator
MDMTDDRLKLLSEVATLYYEDNLTQQEIAQRLNLSRSNISRLLIEARRRGVVTIIINYPWQTAPAIQDALVERYALSGARVLKAESGDYDWVQQGIGHLAARYLEGMLHQVKILGLGWGSTVLEFVKALRPAAPTDTYVVQVVGAIGSRQPIDYLELVRRLADALGGRYRYLHAPSVVETEAMKQALSAEQAIRETLELARKADVAILGIGSAEPDTSSLLHGDGFITEFELEAARASGAVGEICARHFDAYGRVLDIELNKRIVGLDIESLRDIKQVIGVAGGVHKARAILGALRGRLVDVLVTDDGAASEVLRIDQGNPS